MVKNARGKTTVSPGGLLKRTFWLHPEEVKALRQQAFDQEVSQANLVRAALRQYLGLVEESDGGPEDTGPEND